MDIIVLVNLSQNIICLSDHLSVCLLPDLCFCFKRVVGGALLLFLESVIFRFRLSGSKCRTLMDCTPNDRIEDFQHFKPTVRVKIQDEVVHGFLKYGV